MSDTDSHVPPDDLAPEGEPFRLLFVCTGNTCRSPLAEALTRRALQQRGWRGVQVRSAGIAAQPNAPASEEARKVAARHGIDLGPHRTSQLDTRLVEWADLVLTMSPSHLAGVTAAGGGDRAAVITVFAQGRESGVPPRAVPGAVPDPFGGSEEDYEATYRELSDLVERVLDRLAPVVAP